MMLVGFLGCYGAIQESQCLLGTVSSCVFELYQAGTLPRLWIKIFVLTYERLWESNVFSCFLSQVLLLLGDPVCLWSCCSNLGFHEQGHSKWYTHTVHSWVSTPGNLVRFTVFKTTCATRHCPQISKELINFYDSAYIKALDVSGSPSKDAAIKVLDVFHKTVRQDEKSSLHLPLMWYERDNCDLLPLLLVSSSARLLW